MSAPEPGFHRLTVKAVREETTEAKSFQLQPERGETALFRYRPGQFLTFLIERPEGPVTRSYSLCSTPATDPAMTVCVKRVEGGIGSNWFCDWVTQGMRLQATPPSGRFVLHEGEAPLLLIAGGSGITPCIGIVKQALFETGRRVKLLYANRDRASVIYHDDLAGLASRFAERFTCQHWLDDAKGYLAAADIRAAADGWEGADCYICGPEPLMELAEETLETFFDGKTRILIERFLSPEAPAEPSPAAAPPPSAAPLERFHITLDGEERDVPLTPGQTLLEAALTAGLDVPNSCQEGHCGTCMAKLKSGEVSMTSTRALSKRNKERGLILACQARPATLEPLWLDFDL